MRTTLTLDDDVASQLESYRSKQKLTFREAVNSALRLGLAEVVRPKPRKAFRTKALDLGECLVPSVDNVWEVLDDLEPDLRDGK